mmetsp:Transcript_159/g.306  ORF Transcript_159/g.306 Transcript_159/m.306 type:complete len:568 (+) Transcript_159:401-2104(+)|eukprot:CAMPEP_0184658582 /NCGR_PEP_ID=MMETSP0308-20130426/26029_1 /TAXON_ID=38269 /ORGANISM="Gloeochaete witrockiana, Strain SAG 46.84" /LENGTH=567 /DNA_ID=CAMNT_0027097693 /DNA_START=299 /DNA_END=2002 /DNA_ORIENTATION=+
MRRSCLSTWGLSTAFFLLTLNFLVASAAPGGSPISWESRSGKIYANGVEFVIKGCNWYGGETGNKVPHGLWSASLDNIVNFIATNNFNAVRLPFSLQMISQNPSPGYIDATANPRLIGLRAMEVMDQVILALQRRNILVMLDMHRANYDQELALWYNAQWPEAQVISVWKTLARRYSDPQRWWNVFAADLINEPHGATWGSGDASTDWDKAAGRLGNAVLSVSPHWLIFVEGVAEAPGGYYWGEDFTGIKRGFDVPLSNMLRLVYSPHLYGPSVYEHDFHKAPNYPRNMPAIFSDHIGWIASTTGRAVVLGEWGCPYKIQRDKQWMDTFIAFLRSNNLPSGFYWTLNVDSLGTDGLLTNYSPLTGDPAKLGALAVFPYTNAAFLSPGAGPPPTIRRTPTRTPPPLPPRPTTTFVASRPTATTRGGVRTAARTPLSATSVRTRTRTRAPTLRPVPTNRPSGGGCTVRYTTPSVWPTGFTASVKFTSSSALTQWTLVFVLPTGQSVSQLWDGTVSSSGQTITVHNLSYNGDRAANAEVAFGFNGNKPSTGGNPGSPSMFTLNGVVCSIA